MCWNAKYALLLLSSTIITYFSGILLEYIKKRGYTDAKEKKLKNIVVAFSFISNLGILFYFKYFNFIVGILGRILAIVHIQLVIPTFDIVLPVGISFYTFQALSYTMDVYRDDIYAENSFLNYALFVSFFPQLVAGPIERSKNLLKQLSISHDFNYKNFLDGFMLMIWGYFLKMVIADRIALFVDTIYENFEIYTGVYLILATGLFAIQIYCDFYGYSTIAMGAAKVMGFNLMENFNAPYLSRSVAEFWRRWHISLSTWFRDYLYIPLGGNRKGKCRKYINILIVFLVSGLWHGAHMTYIIWGGLNGIYQVVGGLTQNVKKKMSTILKVNKESIGYKITQCLVTFGFVDFAWIFLGRIVFLML